MATFDRNQEWETAFDEPDEKPISKLCQEAREELLQPRSDLGRCLHNGFKDIDNNSDSFLSSTEIREADLPLLGGVHLRPDVQFAMKRLHDDGPQDAKGISQMDLAVLTENEIKQDVYEFASFIRSNFWSLDQNQDGFISKDDLQRLIAEPTLKQSVRVGLMAFVDRFDQISGLSDDEWGFENSGITRADLDRYIH